MKLQEYFDHYEKAHRHPGNRLCHGIGIPSIIVSLLLLFFTEYTVAAWSLFIVGWAFQFVGHALEKTWPEFMKNPIYLVIGPLYFFDKILKRSKKID